MMSLSKEAMKYLGAREGGSQHRQIIDLYNTIRPLPRGYRVTYKDAWCAPFVSAMIKKCGYSGPFECSANRLRESMSKYKVKEGQKDDIIFYDWNGDKWSDHVGIIVRVMPHDTYEVIEGNKNNSVGIRYIMKNSGNIQGIYRLPGSDEKPVKKPGRKKSVKTIAKEVIEGKWGNGAERVKKLKEAGYNPVDVQKEVNKMI